MKKFYIVVVLVAAVAGLLFYVGSQLDSIVERLIEDHGSAATRTPVRVAGVSINLSEANGHISNLTVGNPEGFHGNAIEMDNFSITLDPSSLTSDVIIIEEITVQGARFDIRQQAGRNNLRELLRNLDVQRSDDPGNPDEAGKKIIINRFTLAGVGGTVSAPGLDEVRAFELPPITLRDVGRRTNGATAAELAQQLLRPIVNEALQSAAAETLKEKASEKLDEVVDGVLQGIFGGEKVPE